MSGVFNSVGEDLSKVLGPIMVNTFYKFLPKLIEVYLDTYDTYLSRTVTDKDSLANPDYFYEEYKQALDKFDYIDDSEELLIRIPTEDTFNFSGRLGFISLIVQGTAGRYLELSQNDYDLIKSNKDINNKIKRAINDLPSFFDTTTPKELRFYLLHTRNSLYKTIEDLLGKKLVVFPFSNSAPIYLFDDGVKFFEDNIDSLIEKAIDSSIKEVKRRKG